MASAHGFTSLTNSGITHTCSSQRYHLLIPQIYQKINLQSCSRVSTIICNSQNPSFAVAKRSKTRDLRLFNSVELDSFLTSDDEGEMSDGFFEAIEELERMNREPSDVLEEMNERLSARELQLVLVYFSQEGRDSWCALEVFEWLRKENRVDEETMELMVSLMCAWLKKLIEGKQDVGYVVDILVDMDCVGLKPGFSMIEKAVSFYWEIGEKERAVSFVKEVLKRGIGYYQGDRSEGHKGGPAGYLAWKMMADGKYRDAVNLVINLKESGFRPEAYSYLIAMTAVVKELNEFTKALRKVKGFSKSGLVAELDPDDVGLIEKYQSDLVADGVRLSNWVIQEEGPSLHGLVHERLLAMFIIAGRGLEAERQLWNMKFVGKEADSELYDIVLAICASQNEEGPIARLVSRTEIMGSVRKKKTLSWLLRGYMKGGHFDDAAEILIKMLDCGLHPEFLDRVAVLQGVRKRIRQTGDVEAYLKLCKRLSDEELTGPCVIYLHMRKHKLWVIKML